MQVIYIIYHAEKNKFCVKFCVQHDCKLFLIDVCTTPALFSSELWTGSFLKIPGYKSFNNNNQTSKIRCGFITINNKLVLVQVKKIVHVTIWTRLLVHVATSTSCLYKWQLVQISCTSFNFYKISTCT